MTPTPTGDGASGTEPDAPATAPQPTLRQLSLLLGVAAVVGVVSAALASGFYWLQRESEDLVWKDIPERLGATTNPPWWWVLAVLLVGAIAVWGARKLPGDGGHKPLHGFGMDIGPKEIVSVLLAAFATLVSGAVLGPEAPLVAIGTALGAFAVRRQPGSVVQVMALSGAMAAIGTIFGNPLVTAVLMLEALVMAGGGAALGMALLPAMLALACGYLVQTGIGSWQGLGYVQLNVPGLQPVSGISVGDLVGAVVVGLIACIVTAVAREIGARTQVVAERRPLPLLLVTAAVMAGLAILVVGVTGQNLQVILFSGEAGIPYVLGETSAAALLLIIAAKAIAYGMALGGGWRAGPVFPSAFLGVTAGVLAALAVSSLSQTILVAAGIAAATAFTMRLVVTGALLGVLLTVSAGAAVTPAAIIGAIVGVLARHALDRLDTRQGLEVAPPAGAGSAVGSTH